MVKSIASTSSFIHQHTVDIYIHYLISPRAALVNEASIGSNNGLSPMRGKAII